MFDKSVECSSWHDPLPDQKVTNSRVRSWYYSLHLFPRVKKEFQSAVDNYYRILSEIEACTETARALSEKSNQDINEDSGSIYSNHHWLELKHRCLFFIASCYHSLEDQENESKFYEEAEKVREIMLSVAKQGVITQFKKFQELSRKIRDKLKEDGGTQIKKDSFKGGLVLSYPFESLAMLRECLNQQMKEIDSWREKLRELLCTDFFIKEKGEAEDPTGEEYEKAATNQNEADIYLVGLVEWWIHELIW